MTHHKRLHHSARLAGLLFLTCLGSALSQAATPVNFTDSGGVAVVLPCKPQRVVSLVPAVTEIICQLGMSEAVKGITYHDADLPAMHLKSIVGGFSAPSIARMEALDPDMIILSSLHREVRKHFEGNRCRVIEMESRSIEDLYEHIRLLGAIFQREQAAEEMVRNIRSELQLVAQKTDCIPPDRRKRVMRLMGRNQVMTPGQDSFQNEFIRAAGGIPPQLGKNGNVVEVSLDEWKRLDPQVIYGCGRDRGATGKLLSEPGWKDVEAVRKGRIYFFPCELTCRASVHTGEFIEWLASTIYVEEFTRRKNQVFESKRIGTKRIEVSLDYVRSARVDETIIFDFPNKTLIVQFKEPMRVTSTLEGEHTWILTVGNHYSPPPCWTITHRLGLGCLQKPHLFSNGNIATEQLLSLYRRKHGEPLRQESAVQGHDRLCLGDGWGGDQRCSHVGGPRAFL